MCLGLIVAGAWAVSAPAFARDEMPRLEWMASELQLDAAGKAKVRAIIEGSRAEAEALRGQLVAARRALRDALKDEGSTENSVLARGDAVDALHAKLHRLRLRALLQMRQLLTPEQRQKLRTLRQKRREAFRHACQADAAKFCAGSGGPGKWGGKGRCLFGSLDKLSPACRAAVLSHGRGERRGGPGL